MSDTEFGLWLLRPDRTLALVTESGPDGRIGFATVDVHGRQAHPTWLAAAAGWAPVGWAGEDIGILWRRVDGHSELGRLHATGDLDIRQILGRPFAASADEVLVAVSGAAGTVLCRHWPGTDSYQILDATVGVRSVAGWNPRSGRLVITTATTVRVVAYDGHGSEELPVEWHGRRPVNAVGDGDAVGLTGLNDDGSTLTGLLDLHTRAVRWFPEHAGLSCTDVAASGSHLLAIDWQDHAYYYRALTADGITAGELRSTDGLATDLRFAVDPGHVLGWYQSPARPPATVRWELRRGQEWPHGHTAGAGIRWRHREVPAADGSVLPEWVFEPGRDAHGGVVVYLHGGPRSRLNQIYEPVIAALVADGWTVVGMNYPGSIGYGSAYRDVTLGDWGGADVAAVAGRLRMLRAESAGPVCLYGVSYGGYLALRAAEAADAVAVWAPVTDLPLLVESATGARRRWLEAELAELLRMPALLTERSPARRPASLVEVPLLVGHGAGDDRIPVEQSRQLVDVLDAAPVLRYLEDRCGTHSPSDWQWWAHAVVTHLRDHATASLTGRRES